MWHFQAIHSPASTGTPIWRSGWDHPQHRQKYVNISLAPAQPCQEHREGGCVNKTTEIFAWLWGTKTHPNDQTALGNDLLCKNSSAAAKWEQNLMEWLCSDISQHVTTPHITYRCRLIYKNILYSCRDITEIFCFLEPAARDTALLTAIQVPCFPNNTSPSTALLLSHKGIFLVALRSNARAVYSGLFTYTIYALTSGFELKSRTLKRISLSSPNWEFLLYKHNRYMFTSWTAVHNEIQHYWTQQLLPTTTSAGDRESKVQWVTKR